MKKRIDYLLCTAFMLFGVIYSCTNAAEIDTATVQEEALRDWVALNYPDLDEYEDGLFFKFFSSTGEEKAPESRTYLFADWFEVTFSGQTLDKEYYYNMDPTLADTLGQYTKFHNYIPEMLSYSSLSSSLSVAQSQALSRMVPGDSVVIVAAYQYVSSGNTGADAFYPNIGTTVVGENAPVLIHMKFENEINDMYAYERDLVREYAVNEMGKDVSDTVKGVSLMYMEKLIANPEGDSIGQDSAVYLYYSGQFLDGFLFDTNVDEVAEEHNKWLSSNSYTYMSFTPSSSTDDSGSDYIEGFQAAVLQLREGEKAKFVFTSNLGYGDTGSKSSDYQYDETYTRIPARAPLVFTIEVLVDDDL